MHRSQYSTPPPFLIGGCWCTGRLNPGLLSNGPVDRPEASLSRNQANALADTIRRTVAAADQCERGDFTLTVSLPNGVRFTTSRSDALELVATIERGPSLYEQECCAPRATAAEMRRLALLFGEGAVL